ncbi:hypothetical protein Bhyg_09090, partial [Pseudolycoriella hygida]
MKFPHELRSKVEQLAVAHPRQAIQRDCGATPRPPVPDSNISLDNIGMFLEDGMLNVQNGFTSGEFQGIETVPSRFGVGSSEGDQNVDLFFNICYNWISKREASESEDNECNLVLHVGETL